MASKAQRRKNFSRFVSIKLTSCCVSLSFVSRLMTAQRWTCQAAFGEGDVVVDWGRITHISVTHNNIRSKDLYDVKELVDLCSNINVLEILSGNTVSKSELEKVFSGITIC